MDKLKIEEAQIMAQERIADGVYAMRLQSEMGKALAPGQFINVRVRHHFLRRPISVASIEDRDEGRFTIIYKAIGSGTTELALYAVGETVEIMGPLGRGFPIHEDKDAILIIGGGLGVPPLYEVAKVYRTMEKTVVACLGFRSWKDVFLEEEFRALGVETHVATDDGSYGFAGNVLELIDAERIDLDFVYTVGPRPLLRAVQARYVKGYLSLEERMACGSGMCMGCVCHDREERDKSYRVCKDGPVFELGRVAL